MTGAERAASGERRRAAEALIGSHDAVFRRTARRYSLCADDAEDAYQRALEILLTRAPEIDAERLVRWMQTVTKHEALAVRRQRERLLSGSGPGGGDADVDPLDIVPSDSPEPSEGAASRERVARSREALRALKPQEVRALALKAQGYSYAEIRRITGWTYTKVNRCMAEGRKRFLKTFASIEDGTRCDELADALSAFSDGELEPADQAPVVAHLESCAHCRAKLRAFRGLPQRVLGLAPAGLAAEPSLPQRLAGHAGAALERAGDLTARAKEVAGSLAHKLGPQGAEAATATAGSPRGMVSATMAIVLACGAAGGGAYCAVNGIGPVDLGAGADRPQEGTADVTPPPVAEPPDTVLAPEAAPAPEVIETAADRPAARPEPPSPDEQSEQQFGFEESASSAAPSASGSSTSPGSSGSGSGFDGGGGSGGGGAFGFER